MKGLKCFVMYILTGGCITLPWCLEKHSPTSVSLQYEALNKSNIYEGIKDIFLCGFVVSIKAFLIK